MVVDVNVDLYFSAYVSIRWIQGEFYLLRIKHIYMLYNTTLTYRRQSQNFFLDFFLILMTSPWYDAALKALLALNKIFLFFIELSENILQNKTTQSSNC